MRGPIKEAAKTALWAVATISVFRYSYEQSVRAPRWRDFLQNLLLA